MTTRAKKATKPWVQAWEALEEAWEEETFQALDAWAEWAARWVDSYQC